MSELTAAEAFAKAGYPVPEGATLAHSHFQGYTYDHIWYIRKPCGYRAKFRAVDGWNGATAGVWDGVDLRNLPAKDCLDALPKCVREVL